MKKLLSVLLLALLLVTYTSLAEDPATEPIVETTEATPQEPETFDHTVFKNFNGYSYDKFDKTWSYYGAYLEQYTDATVVIGLQAENSKEGAMMIKLYSWIRDAKNIDTLFNVKQLYILADDTLITCELADVGNFSMTLISPNNVDVLKLLAEADEIAFKIYHSKGNTTLEPTKQEIADFAAAAKRIYESNMASYLGTSTDWFSENYPIVIEE